MSPRVRLSLFLVAAPLCAVALLWGLLGLPGVGHGHSAYGEAINHLSVPQQRITDAVTAVNFDYRGGDTIGEEFLLLAAVMSVQVLLRHLRSDRGEATGRRALRRLRRPSEALRAYCLCLVAPTLVLGVYVASHGQLTPGGGFQGGAILASGLALVFLAGEYVTFRKVSWGAGLAAAEAVGAGGFVAVGMVGLFYGASFLSNPLPLGELKAIDSGGMVGIISALIGLEVGAGMVSIVSELAEHALALAPGEG